jgi:hypothetical protein
MGDWFDKILENAAREQGKRDGAKGAIPNSAGKAYREGYDSGEGLRKGSELAKSLHEHPISGALVSGIIEGIDKAERSETFRKAFDRGRDTYGKPPWLIEQTDRERRFIQERGGGTEASRASSGDSYSGGGDYGGGSYNSSEDRAFSTVMWTIILLPFAAAFLLMIYLWTAEEFGWSPYGTRTVGIVRPRAEIQIMSLNGKVKKTLSLPVSLGGYNKPEDLRWSPDRSKIAFTSDSNIYVINADGTGLIRLTNDGDNHYPKWWPDSKKIIFERHTIQEGWKFYMVHIDGRRQVEPVNLSPDVSTRPEWSQDGRKIAFTGFDGQLWVGEFVGGKITKTKRLTNKADGWRVTDKRWSKDGTKIAFYDPYKRALFIIDCDGSNLKKPLWANRAKALFGFNSVRVQ